METTITFDGALEAVRGRLGENAFAHSERVATTARELAATYGVDTELAALAGLLHDWDRETPADELLGDARDAGIEVTPVDAEAPYLLHARTAARSLERALPGLPAEVLRAVSLHTMGAPDMGPLDMVVYIADMIEPGRSFAGVEVLRAATQTASLPELFALAYQQSVAHLVSTRRRIHPDTVAVWNRLVAGDAR